MQRTWNERLSEIVKNDPADELRALGEEPFSVFLLGASRLSGLIWNTRELMKLTNVKENKNTLTPANLSYIKVLGILMDLEANHSTLADVFYYLLFYGIIEPLSKIGQTGRAAGDSLPQNESEV